MPPVARDNSDTLSHSTPRLDVLDANGVPIVGVAGKRHPRYSASTVSNFAKCKRLWFWEYVVGLQTETTAAQAEGTSVHSVLEEYLRDGKVPSKLTKEGKIASPGLQYLPVPGEYGINVEDSFKMGTWPGGPTITGTIDLWCDPPEYETYLIENIPDSFDADDGSPEFAELVEELTEKFRADYTGWVDLYDHKTTSDLKWALCKDDEPLRKEGNNARLRDDVQCNMYARYLLKIFPRAVGIRAKWVYYRKNSHPSASLVDVELTREHVKKKWAEIVEALDEMSTMIASPPSLDSVPATVSHCGAYRGCPHRAKCFPNPTERTFMNFKEQMKKQIQKKAETAPAATKETKTKPTLAAKPTTVAPVEQTVTAPTTTASKPSALELLKAKAAAAKSGTTVQATATAAPAPAQTEVNQVADVKALEEPKKTRAKKEAVAPKQDDAPFFLFIDDHVIKGGSTAPKSIEMYLEAIGEEVAKAAELPHYKNIPYGQGPAALIVAVKEKLDAEPLTGAWKCTVLNEMTSSVLHLLVDRATFVTQGRA